MAAGAFAGGAALAVPLAAPELLRRRILTAIHERTGLSAELASVDLDLGGVTLHQLSMHGTHASGVGLDASFDQVELSLDPLGAMSADITSVRGVVIRGGHVHVVTPAEASAPSDPPSPSTNAERSLPALDVSGLSVSVADDRGELARASAVAATVESGAIEVTASDVEIVGGPGWTVASASVGARRDPDGELRLTRVSARDASLRVAADETDRLSRLRTALSRLRGTRGAAEADDAGEGRGLMARLGAEFVAELTGVRIDVESTDDASASVSSLSAVLRREGDHLTTEGEARPGESGTLSWELDVEPDALVAVGQVTLDRVSLAVLAPLMPHLPLLTPELTEISGALTLEHADLSEVHGSATLEIAHLGLSDPRIAPAPIREIALSVRGNASWSPLERELQIHEVFVRSVGTPGAHGAEARLSGTVLWQPERYAFDVTATLPPTRCHDAIGAIPADLLGELSGLDLSGTLGGFVELHLDSADLDAARLRVRVADGCRFVTVPAFADPARFDRPFHHRAEENDGDVFEMDTGPGTAAWTPIAQMSPFLLHAVLAHEDASFFVHDGFAPWAIRDALVANLRAGRYVRGASTITMQLVKNAFLHREKTLARKVQEVLLTWWVETSMTKEDILELYLNVIELGDGVYGIRDAAMHWFGRTPAELSAAESVYIAMILPNPPAFSAEHRALGHPPETFRRRMANFLRHLGETGRYDAAAVEAGIAEIEIMRFHRWGDPMPAPRALAGTTAALPIEAFDSGPGLGAITTSDDAGDTEADDPAEVSWDRWEEVVP